MHIYQLTGRNVDVTDALRGYVDQKLSKLERFNDHITDAKVVLTVRDVRDTMRRNRVEVQLNVPHGLIRAEEHHSDMYAAIDKVGDVLERQLRKFKTKHLRHRHEGGADDVGGLLAAPVEDGPDDLDEAAAAPEIVRQKKFDLRPMSPEDAALQMEALHHDFYVFMNAATEHCAVVYRRRDGHYGLIEPRV